MNEADEPQVMLTRALRMLAEDDTRLSASRSVETRLLVEVQATAQARRRAQLKMYATAAVLFLAVAAGVWRVAEPRPTGPAKSVLEDELATEFYPLYYSNVPTADAQIVRLEVTRSALDSFGVDPWALNGGQAETVLADVIVGQDGLARAVRFVAR